MRGEGRVVAFSLLMLHRVFEYYSRSLIILFESDAAVRCDRRCSFSVCSATSQRTSIQPSDRGCVMKMQEHVERVNRSLFHPDGTCIASGSDDRTIKIWDLRRKRLIQHYDAHAGPVLDLDFNSSQNFLASSSTDRTVKLWDLQEGIFNGALLFLVHEERRKRPLSLMHEFTYLVGE